MGTTSFLSMMEARMPPGFRFHPRDEELIVDYLAKRISSSGCQMMIDVDLNKVEPWDLPGEACVGGKEWYFYSLRDRKYATGQRTNRATVSGYWKATGKDRPVIDSRRINNNNGAILVGMRKTLVFYKGRAPKGKKTDWVMHEFRIETTPQDYKPSSSSSSLSSSSKEDWVLCRVFYKSRALSARPDAATTPAAATATTATTNTTDNCYEDTAGSSIDTFVNMEQRQLPPQFNLQGYDQQVPCFSNFLLPTSSSARPPQSSSYQMLAAFPPMGSFAQMGGLPSLSPYLGSISVDNKPSFASLQQHLHKPPAHGPTELTPPSNAATGGTSTGIAFMNTDQSGVQPMWNSC